MVAIGVGGRIGRIIGIEAVGGLKLIRDAVPLAVAKEHDHPGIGTAVGDQEDAVRISGQELGLDGKRQEDQRYRKCQFRGNRRN